MKNYITHYAFRNIINKNKLFFINTELSVYLYIINQSNKTFINNANTEIHLTTINLIKLVYHN